MVDLRPAHLLLIGALLASACQLTEKPSTEPAAGGEASCEQLKQAVQAAALLEAACTTDADCGSRDVPVCNLEGLGCYAHITNKRASTQALDQAIADLHAGACSLVKCDCAPSPSAFACVEQRCTGVSSGAAMGVPGQGVELNQAGAVEAARKALLEELGWKSDALDIEVEETESAFEVHFREPPPTPPGGEAMVIVNKRTGSVQVHPGE